MARFGRFLRAFVKMAISFTLSFMLFSMPAGQSWAADLSDSSSLSANSSTEQPATLVGPKEDAPIPLYLRPAANQPNVGYGMSGSAVTVLERVASFLPEADQDAAWNHIRLEDAPYTEGWVQGRFLSMPNNDEIDDDLVQ